MHIVWNDLDSETYRQNKIRFCNETLQFTLNYNLLACRLYMYLDFAHVSPMSILFYRFENSNFLYVVEDVMAKVCTKENYQ